LSSIGPTGLAKTNWPIWRVSGSAFRSSPTGTISGGSSTICCARISGANTGPKVLTGQIRRGTGMELTAVLWSSDLRGFTERSDRLPSERMITILNALFEAQAAEIRGHDGEILKFIGDGLLAIFPIAEAEAVAAVAKTAVAAARNAVAAVARLSNHPALDGEPPLDIVVALHVGTVHYGNIGAADRLDFTVIGPAVNLVSRIENAAKILGQPIVVSAELAAALEHHRRDCDHHSGAGRSSAAGSQEGGAPAQPGLIGKGRPAIGRLARSSPVRRGSAGSACTRWPAGIWRWL
jgi:class 3 adenylate cyclase